jgi:hypothetical protein
MNTSPERQEVEVITRFLLRFGDLVSGGSNAENLLRAAQLLKERSDCASLAAQLEALSRDDHVQVPVSILRLAAAQFESLADAFEKSGNVVSQAMCSASASTLRRALEAKTPGDRPAVFPPKLVASV